MDSQGECGTCCAESLHQEAKSEEEKKCLSIELGLSFVLCLMQRFCKPQFAGWLKEYKLQAAKSK